MKKAKTMVLGAAAMSAGVVTSGGFRAAQAVCEGEDILPAQIRKTQWLDQWWSGDDIEVEDQGEGYFPAPHDSLYGYQSSGSEWVRFAYLPANGTLKGRGGWVSLGSTSWTWGTTYSDTSCCSTTVPVVFKIDMGSVADPTNPGDAVYGVDLWSENGLGAYGVDAIRWAMNINDGEKAFIGAAIDTCVACW